MSDELKNRIHHAREEIGDMLDEMEDKLEDLADESQENWQRVKRFMQQANQRFVDATKALEQDGDELRVRAHLAAMEARNRIDAAKETLMDFANKARNRSHELSDHAKVQAKLAEMEARDFVGEAKTAIGDDLNHRSHELHSAGIAISDEVRHLSQEIRARLKR